MSFKGRSILNTFDLSKEDIAKIMEVSADMDKLVKEKGVSDLLADMAIAVIFMEPSTRTQLSFVTAVERLGAKVVPISDAKSSSAAKGESLIDMAKTVEGYVDAICIRQPQIGGADDIAAAINIPVINGGDGAGQHPTQALLDLYTIIKEKGTLENLKVAMVGDLKNGRTVHSLSYALDQFNPTYTFCAPEALQMPQKIQDDMKAKGIECTCTEDLQDALKADIIYMTRIQRERFEDPAEYEKYSGHYILTRDIVEKGANPEILIMHPLPRVDEITTDVDDLPNAAYFRQAHNGLYLRMALLALVTGRA